MFCSGTMIMNQLLLIQKDNAVLVRIFANIMNIFLIYTVLYIQHTAYELRMYLLQRVYHQARVRAS